MNVGMRALLFAGGDEDRRGYEDMTPELKSSSGEWSGGEGGGEGGGGGGMKRAIAEEKQQPGTTSLCSPRCPPQHPDPS
jgi:hypothetical protein